MKDIKKIELIINEFNRKVAKLGQKNFVKKATEEKFKALISEYDSYWGMLEDLLIGLYLVLEDLQLNPDPELADMDYDKFLQLHAQQVDMIRTALTPVIEKLKIHDEQINNLFKKAQLLNPGESTLSYNNIKEKAEFYKNQITANPTQPHPGWSKPGSKALIVISKILSGAPVEHNEKEWAKLDLKTNFKHVFTEAQLSEFDKILNSYNNSL